MSKKYEISTEAQVLLKLLRIALGTSKFVQTHIIKLCELFLLRTSAIEASFIALGLASVRVCTKTTR